MASGERITVVAIVCLTAVVLFATAGITVTAVLTDRDVHVAEGFTFAGALTIALLGGLSIRTFRQHRWQIERPDEEDEEA